MAPRHLGKPRCYTASVATAKQIAHDAVEAMPEESSLEDIAYNLYVRAQVAQGIADLDAERTMPHDQVIREAGEWLRTR